MIWVCICLALWVSERRSFTASCFDVRAAVRVCVSFLIWLVGLFCWCRSRQDCTVWVNAKRCGWSSAFLWLRPSNMGTAEVWRRSVNMERRVWFHGLTIVDQWEFNNWCRFWLNSDVTRSHWLSRILRLVGTRSSCFMRLGGTCDNLSGKMRLGCVVALLYCVSNQRMIDLLKRIAIIGNFQFTMSGGCQDFGMNPSDLCDRRC